MTENSKRSIGSWVQLLSSRKIPVMRQTVRALAEARKRIDKVNGREVAEIVMRDPLMAVRVLAYVRPYHAKRQMKEVTSLVRPGWNLRLPQPGQAKKSSWQTRKHW